VIATLGFGSPRSLPDGRVVREPRFTPRSTLPLSAACVVANGVREELGRLLGAPVDVELVEPAIPGSAERRLLVDGATVWRVRGRICDGFVIVRPADARRLAGLAFGEPERDERQALSEIERATFERIASGLVPLCNVLCGTLGPVVRESPERAACDLSSYFEIRTTGMLRIAIGFALSLDPPEIVTAPITIAELGDVELRGTVEFARGTLAVPAFCRLAPGATVALETALGDAGRLTFGDVCFARGTCGVRGGRATFLLGT